MPTVLSVQSHVVHGVVGNKAACLPLQLRGFTVDPLNVVHLSNHTGCGVFKGQRMDADGFSTVVDGLRQNGILATYDAVLSGYVGNSAILAELATVVAEVKAAHPAAVFLCDPVCGDNGKLYVKEDVPDTYRDVLLPLADVATPNGFEASVLSGVAVSSRETAQRASDWFHGKGVAVVVITSFVNAADGATVLFASHRTAAGTARVSLAVPQVEGYFTGTGDLFSALFLAEWTAARDVPASVERSVAVLQAVLRRTAGSGARDLQLVACIDELRGGGRPTEGVPALVAVPFTAPS
jgi:pyridoxine kinase